MMMIPRRNGNGLDFWDEVLPDSFFTEKESKLMKTDLKEKDGKYFLEIDIPGYEKEDIKIELHDGYLTVSAEKNMSLTVSDTAKGFILEKGTNLKFGARPLRRAIQRYVEDEISEMILRNEVHDGQNITVDFENDNLKFDVK